LADTDKTKQHKKYTTQYNSNISIKKLNLINTTSYPDSIASYNTRPENEVQSLSTTWGHHFQSLYNRVTNAT